MADVEKFKKGLILDPQSSDPAGAAGQLVYNSTDTTLKFNNGSSWVDVLDAATSAATTKTTTYNAVLSDGIIFADTSAGAWTLTLYSASGNAGKKLTVIKITSDYNVLTIDGDGSETIRGATTFLMHTQNQAVTFVSDGTNWQVENHFAQTPWTDAGAVTITATTTNPTKPTTVDEDHFWWRRDGSDLVCRMEYFAASSTGAATGTGDYLFELPNSLSADTTKITAYSTVEGGPGAWIIKNKIGSVSSYYDGAGGVNYTGSVVLYDATKFRIFLISPGDQGCVGSAYQTLTVNNMCYVVEIRVPISGWEE